MIQETFVLQFSAVKTREKYAQSRKLNENPLIYTMRSALHFWIASHNFEARWTSYTSDNEEISSKTQLFSDNLWTKASGLIVKFQTNP